MSETQQGPMQKYVAWRTVPYLRGTTSQIYTSRDAAVQAAKEIDGENNWMIEGLTRERYEAELKRNLRVTASKEPSDGDKADGK